MRSMVIRIRFIYYVVVGTGLPTCCGANPMEAALAGTSTHALSRPTGAI
jgi:hypothetical protein